MTYNAHIPDGYTVGGTAYEKLVGWELWEPFSDPLPAGVEVVDDGIYFGAAPVGDFGARSFFVGGLLSVEIPYLAYVLHHADGTYDIECVDPGAKPGLPAHTLVDDIREHFRYGDTYQVWAKADLAYDPAFKPTPNIEWVIDTAAVVTPVPGTLARPSVGRLVAPRPGGGTINATVESLSGLQWSAGTESAFVIPADATLTQIQVTTVTPTGNPTTWVQVGEVTGIDGGGNPIPASDVYVTGPFAGYTDTVSQFYPAGSVLAVAAGANFGATSRLTVRLTFSTGIAAELPMWVQFAI